VCVIIALFVEEGKEREEIYTNIYINGEITFTKSIKYIYIFR